MEHRNDKGATASGGVWLWYIYPLAVFVAYLIVGMVFDALILLLPEGLPSPWDDYWAAVYAVVGIGAGYALRRSTVEKRFWRASGAALVWSAVLLLFAVMGFVANPPEGSLEWAAAGRFPALVIGLLIGFMSEAWIVSHQASKATLDPDDV